ncbi:MAG TPA: hypothetical protein VFQ68_45610 [Streptosporangiaceae bacterium]|nr:hypothetical protein [Streptosporangiaceae bacterium]
MTAVTDHLPSAGASPDTPSSAELVARVRELHAMLRADRRGPQGGRRVPGHRAAEAGVYPGFLARARVRADTGWAIDHILKAIDILLSAHGAGSFADVNPLQRIWRDSSVAARHAVVRPVIGYEVYGKALLGRDDHITPLV